MNKNIVTAVFLLIFTVRNVHAQETSLLANDQSYIGYSLTGENITFIIEDLQSETKGANEYTREADFKEVSESDYCIIEIDRNNNQKVDKQDAGFKLSGLENRPYFNRNGGKYSGLGHCAYTMYEGFPGVFMNNLSRGCDNNKTKAIYKGQWQATDHGSNEHPVWKLTLPLKEVALAKTIGVRVMIYRKYNTSTFSYPKALDGSVFASYTVPLGGYDAASVQKKETETNKAALKAFSQKQYKKTVEYDGVYIDMGNGKYAQLVSAHTANARIVACSGKQKTHYFAYTPYVTDESTSVAIPAVRKIICVGGEFTDQYMEQLHISKIENINELGLTWQNDGRTDDIKSLAVAGKFGSAVSFKSEQPEKMYIPMVNKQTYEDFGMVSYNKKTVSATKREIYPKAALSKGIYALWNNNLFWLFTIE